MSLTCSTEIRSGLLALAYHSIKIRIQSMEKIMKIFIQVPGTDFLECLIQPSAISVINQTIVVDSEDFMDPNTFEGGDVQDYFRLRQEDALRENKVQRMSTLTPPTG